MPCRGDRIELGSTSPLRVVWYLALGCGMKVSHMAPGTPELGVLRADSIYPERGGCPPQPSDQYNGTPKIRLVGPKLQAPRARFSFRADAWLPRPRAAQPNLNRSDTTPIPTEYKGIQRDHVRVR